MSATPARASAGTSRSVLPAAPATASSMAVLFSSLNVASRNCTLQVTSVKSRPPEPDDMAASTSRPPQTPTDRGASTTTSGISGSSGGAMVTLPSVSAAGQQSQYHGSSS